MIVEFPLLITERRYFEVVAECYNEIRTSSTATSTTNNNNNNNSLSKKSSKSNITNQTSKLLSQ